jgi:hypothetical protein
MMALAVAAVGACSRAEAVPPPAIQPPTGWLPLADVAHAASEAAKADGVAVDSAAAWGETAMGCYALALAVHGGSTDGLAKDMSALEKPGYHGQVRTRVGAEDAVDVLACFWNDREPDACAKACAGMMK